MRPIIALTLILLSLASFANAADLLIYADSTFTDATLNDNTPRIVDLYVVHTNHSGSVGVEFGTAASAGFTGVWFGDTSSHVTIGNSTTGVAVGYGACLRAPVLVLTMRYQLFGTSNACSTLMIGPGARFPFIICDDGCFGEYPCNGGSLHVNCAVAIEATTWGKVKALYRN